MSRYSPVRAASGAAGRGPAKRDLGGRRGGSTREGMAKGTSRGGRESPRGALAGLAAGPASRPAAQRRVRSTRPRDLEFRRAFGAAPSDIPPHLSPGQLLAQTLVTSGTMTNRLDHLEGRGLVRRRPDPSDARSVRVQITSRAEDASMRLSRISSNARTRSLGPWARRTEPHCRDFSAASSRRSTSEGTHGPCRAVHGREPMNCSAPLVGPQPLLRGPSGHEPEVVTVLVVPETFRQGGRQRRCD